MRQPDHNSGTLVMIGGAEDKTGARRILTEVARHAAGGAMVIATLASEEPDYQWEIYSGIFRGLGINNVRRLSAASREELMARADASTFDGVSTVFFTGGDQLRLTTKLSGTTAGDFIRTLYTHKRGTIAGTSAGAAALGEIMLMSANVEGAEKHRVDRAFIMARGLGLVHDMVIDQHFAQRARIERLLGAIAENPGVLGVGIDEDTAMVFRDDAFDVIGSGAVYVADGSGITYTNLTEPIRDRTMCLFHVILHVLNNGSRFEMTARKPLRPGTGSEPPDSLEPCGRGDHAARNKRDF